MSLYAATVEAAETGNVFDYLPSSDLIVEGGQLIWKLPPLQYFIGIFAGLGLAVYSVRRFAATGSAHRALLPASRGAWRRFGPARAVLTNGFVWAYGALTVGFAGLVYSGFFLLVRDQVAQTLPIWTSWGPMGASILGTFTCTYLARRFSWWSADGGVELEGMIDDLEEQSESAASDKKSWLFTLSWSGLEDARQRRTAELAERYSVGLIRHAVSARCDLAIDRGQLDETDVKSLLAELSAVPGGEDSRQRFANRRRAIQISSRIVPLDDLEKTIERNDRRKTERRAQDGPAPRGKERRHGDDRRVDGALISVPT